MITNGLQKRKDVLKNIEYKIQERCPDHEINFFESTIKCLTNNQKKVLFYLLVNSNKDDRLLIPKLNIDIECLILNRVISIRKTSNNKYSVAVLPKFPYLKIQLKEDAKKYFHKLKNNNLVYEQ